MPAYTAWRAGVGGERVHGVREARTGADPVVTAVGADEHGVAVGAEVDRVAERLRERGDRGDARNALDEAPGSSSSACFQSPSWPRRQTVPSVLTATTTPGKRRRRRDEVGARAEAGATPGSGSGRRSCPRGSSACRTRPLESMCQAARRLITVPVGGNVGSPGTGANVFPASVDYERRSAVPVRTMIVSPMAETPVIDTPRQSRPGLHHGVGCAGGDRCRPRAP